MRVWDPIAGGTLDDLMQLRGYIVELRYRTSKIEAELAPTRALANGEVASIDRSRDAKSA